MLRRVECKKEKKLHMFKIFLILSLKKYNDDRKRVVSEEKEKRGLPYVFRMYMKHDWILCRMQLNDETQKSEWWRDRRKTWLEFLNY